MTQSKEAFLNLIRENKGIIFKICNSYCPDKNDRDDLAQEIVFNLWKSFAGFDTSFRFSTWMYRIALNVAISFYRRERRSLDFIPFSESLIVFDEDTAYVSETENNIRDLQKFISELKEIDRSIMLLYLDDKSYKEIAAVLGISVTNVSTRINRIKEKLKTNFQSLQK